MPVLKVISVKVRAEVGATAVEYSVILAAIAVVIIGTVTLLGLATEETLCSPLEEWGNQPGQNIETCPE